MSIKISCKTEVLNVWLQPRKEDVDVDWKRNIELILIKYEYVQDEHIQGLPGHMKTVHKLHLLAE